MQIPVLPKQFIDSLRQFMIYISVYVVSICYVDINHLFLQKLDLTNNPVALITLVILAVLMLVLALLARRWDILDVSRISVVPLCGKDGPYKYEITVVTGRRKGAGL